MITMPVFPRRKLRLGALALPQGSTPGKHKAKSSGVEVGAGLHPHPPPLLAASRGIHLQIAEGINSQPVAGPQKGILATSGPLTVSVPPFTHPFYKYMSRRHYITGSGLGVGDIINIKGKYVNKERSHGNMY